VKIVSPPAIRGPASEPQFPKWNRQLFRGLCIGPSRGAQKIYDAQFSLSEASRYSAAHLTTCERPWQYYRLQI
jgi:hypothetical protein